MHQAILRLKPFWLERQFMETRAIDQWGDDLRKRSAKGVRPDDHVEHRSQLSAFDLRDEEPPVVRDMPHAAFTAQFWYSRGGQSGPTFG